MDKLLQFLHSIHALSPALLAHLRLITRVKTISRKEFLLKAGHVCRQICFVEKGLLRSFYLKNEQEISSRFMREGEVIVSLSSFFRQLPSDECIQALEDCELLCMDYTDLQYTCRHFPEFHQFTRVLTEQYFQRNEQMLYALRLQRSHERYAYLMEQHPYLIQRVPSKYLASYLGITDVTLSNIKSRI